MSLWRRFKLFRGFFNVTQLRNFSSRRVEAFIRDSSYLPPFWSQFFSSTDIVPLRKDQQHRNCNDGKRRFKIITHLQFAHSLRTFFLSNCNLFRFPSQRRKEIFNKGTDAKCFNEDQFRVIEGIHNTHLIEYRNISFVPSRISATHNRVNNILQNICKLGRNEIFQARRRSFSVMLAHDFTPKKLARRILSHVKSRYGFTLLHDAV